MQRIYISPGAATDGDGTAAKPRNTLVGLPKGPDVAYGFRRGTTCTQPLVMASGAFDAPMRTFAWALDDGSDLPAWPKPRIAPGLKQAAISLHDCSNIAIADIELSGGEIGIYGYMSSPDAGRSISLDRVDTVDCAGLVLYSLRLNIAAIVGGRASDCTFRRSGNHGTIVYGAVRGFRFERSRWDGNGLATGAHGASSFAHRISYLGKAGWKLQSGSVYARQLGSVTGINGVPQTVYRCVSNAVGSLTQNETAPTMPAVGQYGFSAGVLYVNVGPLGPQDLYSIVAFVERAEGIDYIDCEFANQIAYNGEEGAGLQYDDGATGTAINCRAYGNQGPGVCCNWGERHTISGLVTYQNKGSGFLGLASEAINISDISTLYNGPAGIEITAQSKRASIRNRRHVGEKIGVKADLTTKMTGVSSYAQCVKETLAV